MTSRERLTLTLQGKKADRIPVSPFLWYNNMFEMFGYIPEIDTNYNPPDFDIISKWVEYCDVFVDADAVAAGAADSGSCSASTGRTMSSSSRPFTPAWNCASGVLKFVAIHRKM